MNDEPEEIGLVVNLRIAEFERAVEERLKPALRKAIADVACEFIDGFGDLADIREVRE